MTEAELVVTGDTKVELDGEYEKPVLL